jgi:hypothetical protein
MAPLPSEAVNTTVTFQVDSGAVATLTGPDVPPPGVADLIGVRVNYVGVNQTVTCSFDNHHTHGGEDNFPAGHPHALP